jgi:hypothetical protein
MAGFFEHANELSDSKKGEFLNNLSCYEVHKKGLLGAVSASCSLRTMAQVLRSYNSSDCVPHLPVHLCPCNYSSPAVTDTPFPCTKHPLRNLNTAAPQFRQSPVSHSEAPDSHPGQSLWELGWKMWHWDGSNPPPPPPNTFCFPISIIPPLLQIHSCNICGMDKGRGCRYTHRHSPYPSWQ